MPFDGVQVDERTRILRAWVHELRHGGHRQSIGCQDSHGGICALILLQCHVDGGCLFTDNLTNSEIGAIACRNDGSRPYTRRHTFAEIADFIEREWLKG